MKLKQKLLLAVIATACAAPAFADSDPVTAGQTVNVSVGQVKLLAVPVAASALACTPTTTAGDNTFTCTGGDGGVYKFTSNNPLGNSTTQTISATVAKTTGGTALDNTWKFMVTTGDSADGGATGVTDAPLSLTAAPVVTGILNEATGTAPTDSTITYKVGSADGKVAAYTAAAEGVTVTYSLSAI